MECLKNKNKKWVSPILIQRKEEKKKKEVGGEKIQNKQTGRGLEKKKIIINRKKPIKVFSFHYGKKNFRHNPFTI